VILAPTPELLREQMVTAMRGFPITELLPEQRRYVDLYREEYFRVGSCTEPADRPRAEAAIAALYAENGKERPRFEWGPSPRWGSGRGFSIRRQEEQKPAVALKELIKGSLTDWLSESFWRSVRGWPPYAQIGAALGEELGSSLLDRLYNSNSGISLWDAIKGSQEVNWIAHHLYVDDVIRVPYPVEDLVKLRFHDEVARSCGWWWPYEGWCICTDRPEILEWDDASPPKLRRVRYRDGFEFNSSAE
jgi:hypothetical protein